MELTRPLTGPLKRFEGAIDVFMQSAVASLIWGSIRMAITVRVLVPIPQRLLSHGHLYLKLASDYFKTLESLAMILNRVISSLERFTNHENLFKTNPAVQEAIGILYSDVIYFYTRVVRFYSRSSVRSHCPPHLGNPGD